MNNTTKALKKNYEKNALQAGDKFLKKKDGESDILLQKILAFITSLHIHIVLN